MRNILFRGKDSFSKKWIYGYYIGNDIILEPKYIDTDMCVTVQDDCMHGTIGMYSGFHDSNNKDIFEGDIIKRTWNDSTIDRTEDIYKIVYDDYEKCLMLEDIPGDEDDHSYLSCVLHDNFNKDRSRIDIIGNIYAK